MVKPGSSTFSATLVARSGLALGSTVEKTLAIKAEVSHLQHHVSVLSRRLHLLALESESLRRELDGLPSVALLSHEGDGTDSPAPSEEEADVVAVRAPVAVPAAPTVASFVAHVEKSLVTTVASPFGAQEPEPDVAEPQLPVVQVEQSPSADGAVARHHARRVGWVDDEAGVASRKAQVVEVIVSLSPPPVPTAYNGSPMASATGGGGSDYHTRDPGFVTVGRGPHRQGRGGRH